MNHGYGAERFQAFRQEVRESFCGQVRWRTPTHECGLYLEPAQ